MGRNKEYEEKQRHGTVEIPVGLHKMSYPAGKDTLFYLHWHQEFEILMVTEGELIFLIEKREYRLKKGDCVFINTNLLHSGKSVDGKPCSFFAVDFQYQFLHEDIHSRFAKKFVRPVMDGKLEFPECIQGNSIDKEPELWQQKVVEYMWEMQECPEHDVEPYELLLRSHIMEIWNLFFNNAVWVRKETEEEARVSERLEPVVEYMNENYSYEMTLTELAQIIPMSEGQFCRVFKQNMKMSPMQYLMRYRILQSCRLLQNTDKKIGEIANLSGFNNISYFNKVFLKTIGCTPKEYRRNSMY